MKNSSSVALLVFLCLMGFAIPQYAQGDKFEQAMRSGLAEMAEAKNPMEMKAVAGKFERIAQAEPSQWLAPYYAAFMYTIAGFNTENGDEKDKVLDQAQKWLDKAAGLKNNESDIHSLQGYIYIGRITVSPMMRGMTYSGKVEGEVAVGKELAPNNPRPYLVHGMLLQGMPEFVGGGMLKACPQFELASEKMASFSVKSSIHPDWGKGTLAHFMKACNEQ